MSVIEVIPEGPPTAPNAGRLGRHRQHDVRNEEYRVRKLIQPVALDELPSRTWPRRLGVLDQGDVGACTEFGFCGTVRTSPVSGTLSRRARMNVSNPLGLYSLETASDEFPGQYPPDDTGSSVLAAMRLGKSLGIIGGYHWATAGPEAATALSTVGPAEVGFDWHEGMDHPDEYGVVRPTGQIRGGHAFEAIGRVKNGGEWFWVFVNSWGPSWPTRPFGGKAGRFAMRETDAFSLLEAQGEFAVPLPIGGSQV